MPTNREQGKQIMVHAYNGKLYSFKKKDRKALYVWIRNNF